MKNPRYAEQRFAKLTFLKVSNGQSQALKNFDVNALPCIKYDHN